MQRLLITALLTGMFAWLVSIGAQAQAKLNTELAPTGKLRMGINAANATLYRRADDGSASGIAVELGQFIAQKLGVPFEPLVYSGAATFTASFGKGEWDIIITGRNPLAAQQVDFVSDVILIDYAYLAAPGRQFSDPGQVDRVGVKIGVPRNASADAFLSQRLKFAELVRLSDDTDTVAETLRDGKIDLYATGIDSLQKIARRVPGSTIIGIFETVTFAISTAKGKSPAAKSKLMQWVNAAKAAGLVQQAIDSAGKQGARAAPIEDATTPK